MKNSTTTKNCSSWKLKTKSIPTRNSLKNNINSELTTKSSCTDRNSARQKKHSNKKELNLNPLKNDSEEKLSKRKEPSPSPKYEMKWKKKIKMTKMKCKMNAQEAKESLTSQNEKDSK